MKIEPIYNPHAQINNVVKKTKAEEKDELIQRTKMNVLEKYARKTATKRTGAAGMGSNQMQEEKGTFVLDEKIDPETVGIKLLTQGYM